MLAPLISLTNEQCGWPLWANNQTLPLELLPHDGLCWFRKHIEQFWSKNNLILTYFYFSRDKAFTFMSERQRGHGYFQYNPRVFWVNRIIEMRLHLSKYINLVPGSVFLASTISTVHCSPLNGPLCVIIKTFS